MERIHSFIHSFIDVELLLQGRVYEGLLSTLVRTICRNTMSRIGLKATDLGGCRASEGESTGGNTYGEPWR